MTSFNKTILKSTLLVFLIIGGFKNYAQHPDLLKVQESKYQETRGTIESRQSLNTLQELAKELNSLRHAQVFTSKLLKTQMDKTDNFILSPLSLINVLHLLSEGSSGQTHLEINKAIWNKSTNYKEERNILSEWMKEKSKQNATSLWNANAIWSNKNFPISKEYNDLLKLDYQATVRSLDFNNPRSVDIINAWVKTNTNNLIPSIIDKTNPDDALILTNAIYFKEVWMKPFQKNATREQIFYGKNESSTIPFINGKQTIHYKEFETYEEIGIPMKNNFVYYIILPKAGQQIEDLLEYQIESKNNWASHLTLNKEVMISLPKMKLEQTITLNTPLIEVGIRDMFNPQTAKFKKISKNTGLFVSEVLQKVFLEISEEGVEGAAVTSATMQVTSIQQPVDEIKINRPFIYFIKNLKDNSTIFAGYITEAPTQ